MINKKIGWVLAIVFLLLTLSVMGMIYYFSAENGEESTTTSNGVTAFVLKIIVPHFEEMSAWEQSSYLAKASFYVRKTAHFTEYFLLGLFLSLTVVCIRYMRQKGAGITPFIPLLIGVLYAILDESHQLSVDDRAGQWTDVIIDSCGVLFSLLLVFLPFGIIAHKKF